MTEECEHAIIDSHGRDSSSGHTACFWSHALVQYTPVTTAGLLIEKDGESEMNNQVL